MRSSRKLIPVLPVHSNALPFPSVVPISTGISFTGTIFRGAVALTRGTPSAFGNSMERRAVIYLERFRKKCFRALTFENGPHFDSYDKWTKACLLKKYSRLGLCTVNILGHSCLRIFDLHASACSRTSSGSSPRPSLADLVPTLIRNLQ
jgi:hypothetical protein